LETVANKPFYGHFSVKRPKTYERKHISSPKKEVSRNVCTVHVAWKLAVELAYACSKKGKAVPLQLEWPKGSRKLRFPDFVTTV
jgi:hypothetical protein